MLGARASMPCFTTDVNAADEELRAYYSTKIIFLQGGATMLIKTLLLMMLAAGVLWHVTAKATNVPAIPSCDGGEVGYPAALVTGGEITFYLATRQMPFQGWEPVLCSLQVGQFVQAMQPAREM